MNVSILGCGSATPTLRHLPSCQVIEHNSHLFMIDCGECAQLSMRRHSVKFSRLHHIFISHLHGDHILGLPGLLSSLSLNEFTGEIHVYMMPEGIGVIKSILATFAHEPSYTLTFHPLQAKQQIIYEDEALTVETVPLHHTVPAVGFIFREKPKKRILRADMLEFYQVPVSQRAAIKDGADYIAADGKTIPNKYLTSDPKPQRSYAYCSDTIYSEAVANAIKGVDVLYHEATYADDKADKAQARGHSTARQAAMIAKAAGVEKLILGHYSKNYAGQEEILLKQAQEVFPNTVLADEGKKFEI